MYQLSNFIDNDDIRTLAQLGPFQVIEYQRDLSVSPDSAQTAYFSSVMHVRRRQVLCDLKQANITLQAGAMQWSVGNVNATTGVKGVGDLFGKALRGKVTGESAISRSTRETACWCWSLPTSTFFSWTWPTGMARLSWMTAFFWPVTPG